MPASVALVHDDPSFVASALTALEGAGVSVAAFSDPMVAINEIERAQSFDTLITRVTFPAGKPNGVSLALVLRNRCPKLNVIFVARSENEPHTDDIGTFIPHPVDLQKLVDAVRRCIDPEGKRPVWDIQP